MTLLLRRRSFLNSVAGAALGGLVGGCATPRIRDDQNAANSEDLKALMVGEGDGAFNFTPDVERTMLDSEWEPLRAAPTDWSWWDLDTDKQQPVSWAPPQFCNDYQALFEEFNPPPSKTVVISHDLMEWLAERNAFDLADETRIVLGLRGSMLVASEDDSGWRDRVEISLVEPNHKDMRCLIGVWDRSAKKVRLFRASTVPEVSYMWLQATLASGANLLPTGLYKYYVGTHNLSSTRVSQVGALRLSGYHFAGRDHDDRNIYVLRTLNDLTYSIGDETELWDICQPYDNIHAGIFGADSQNYLVGSKGQKFSSAGCQVLPGGYRLHNNSQGKRAYTNEPIGAWRRFRAALGLAESPIMRPEGGTTDDGKHFYYMLLTGWDAAYGASRDPKVMERYFPLRPGSSGRRVEAHQAGIGVKQSGKFDAQTAERTIFYKRVIAELPESSVTLDRTF